MLKIFNKTLFLLLLLSGLLFSDENKVLAEEYRALWVTRFEMTSTENIANIVQQAAANNFNTLFVQVCGRGASFYNSDILPKDDRVNGFDPLAFLLAEAKKNQLEVHAWVNALYVWSQKELPGAKKHVVNSHPEWLLSYQVPNKKDNNLYLNPAIPAVRNYVSSIYLEIIKKYDVAGVHLDYIRLPGRTEAFASLYTCKDFEKKNGVDPRALLMNKKMALKLYGEEEYNQYCTKLNNYYIENISLLVEKLNEDILKVKPAVLLSAAVISDYDQAVNHHFQDWVLWLEKGYLDLVVPMVYDVSEKAVQKKTLFAVEKAEQYEVPILIGLGAWRLDSETTNSYITFTRELRQKYSTPQLAGVVLFSYDGISKKEGYIKKIKEGVFTEQVKRPDLTIKKKFFADQQKQTENKEKIQELKKEQKFSIIG